MTIHVQNLAILGATGAVGTEMIKILNERDMEFDNLIPIASARSAGGAIECRGRTWEIQDAEKVDYNGIDIVLASAGASVSKKYVDRIKAADAVLIDNTSAFRYDEEVPLVVPEVNREDIPDFGKSGIIANPNCSTIQLVVALYPIHRKFGIKRAIVSTYQATSGGGQSAADELFEQTRSIYQGDELAPDKFAHPIAFNVIPQIDVFLEDGYTKEEWKVMVETNKIMFSDVKVSCTAVRVPVMYGHSEAVWIETEKPITPDEARAIWADAPGVELRDNPADLSYPMPRDASGTDPVYVGRIRKDPTVDNGLAFWVVADNIRKGAALNAIQIAEIVADEYL